MSEERQAFSRRLAEAMRAAGYEPRPSVLMAHFNSRYRGRSVAFQSASRWLGGKSIPGQDKLQVIAQLYGVEPHALRYGAGGARISEGRGAWGATLGAADRAAMAAFALLPADKRRLVRVLISALAEEERGS